MCCNQAVGAVLLVQCSDAADAHALFAQQRRVPSLRFIPCLLTYALRPGYYQGFDNTTQATACLECPANSISDNAGEGIASCLCEPGYYGTIASVNGTACNSCYNNSLSERGSIALSACFCQPGWAGDPQNAFPCAECASQDPNSYSWESSYNCSCNAGYFGVVNIYEDSQEDVANGSSVSTTSLNRTRSILCFACPVDTYNNQTALTTNESCIACPPSSHAANGSSSILDCKCEPGRYAADVVRIVGNRTMVFGKFGNLTNSTNITSEA
eukprot:21082-Rhodomonas_salina.1